MAAMSINAGINGAGGQTKPRGASAPPALGPEHRAAPPPAAPPPPLHEPPVEPRQTTLTSRRGAQQAGVESEGRARPPCKAMSGADTQARMIAEELEKRHGWKIIPEQVTGGGGAKLAAKMKGMA